MSPQTLAQKLAKKAKTRRSELLDVQDIAVSMYTKVLDVADAHAECGRAEVSMRLVFPTVIRDLEEISSINFHIVRMLEADGFKNPIITNAVTDVYDLHFQFE